MPDFDDDKTSADGHDQQDPGVTEDVLAHQDLGDEGGDFAEEHTGAGDAVAPDEA